MVLICFVGFNVVLIGFDMFSHGFLISFRTVLIGFNARGWTAAIPGAPVYLRPGCARDPGAPRMRERSTNPLRDDNDWVLIGFDKFLINFNMF